MSYWVYVIQLDPAVALDRRFRKQNPECDDAKGFFYVGQTALDPEVRFQQHRDGVRASRIVTKHGKYLSRRRCRRCDSREEAERLERTVADSLRRRGFAAYAN